MVFETICHPSAHSWHCPCFTELSVPQALSPHVSCRLEFVEPRSGFCGSLSGEWCQVSPWGYAGWGAGGSACLGPGASTPPWSPSPGAPA